MKFAVQRQKKIYDIINKVGHITIENIVADFNVSKMTAWRDLKELENRGLISKVYGGAIKINENTPIEVPYKERIIKNLDKKKKLAEYVANEFIENGDILFLDGGTTVAELLPYLKNKSVTIITNGLKTLTRASTYSDMLNVICIGGELRDNSFTFVGSIAKQFVNNFNATKFITSGTGLSIENGIMDPDLLEMEIKQEMARKSMKIIAMFDSSKVGKLSMTTSMLLSDIDVLIIDNNIPEEFTKAIKQMGIDLRLID